MRHILLPPVARTEIGGRRGQVTSCYQLRGELEPGPDWGWQQPKYLHTSIRNGFQPKFWFLSFDDLNLQQNDLRVKPVRVWARAWVESVLWYEDIIVLGLNLNKELVTTTAPVILHCAIQLRIKLHFTLVLICWLLTARLRKVNNEHFAVVE